MRRAASSPGRSIRWWMSASGPAGIRTAADPDATAVRAAGRAAPRPASPQLPWRRLVNPFRPLEILSRRPGRGDPPRLAPDPGRDRHRGPRRPGARRLRRAPARPSTASSRRVRLDPAQVEALVATAPAEFDLHARNPERNITFGGTNLVFGAVGGPAFVTDLDRGRRAGNFADFVDYVRIIGALDVIHQEGGGPLEPNDLPVETRHLDMYRTFAVELDKTWQCLGLRRAAGRRRARGRVPRSAASTATTLAPRAVADDGHQHQLAAPPRRADGRRADGDGAPRPAGRRHAVHAGRAR